MIRLNTDKGWARIDSWDDVLARPGFVTDVDPRTVTLKSIIGSYSFASFLPCGLSTCHTPHGRGYLVTTSDGHETNIGKDCGKKYFSVEFVQMAKVFNRELRAQDQREAIAAFQHKIPSVESRLAEVKDGEHGAHWVRKNALVLTGDAVGLAGGVVHMVRRLVKQRSGAITVDRVATPDEAERMRAQGQRGGVGVIYVTDTIGQLDGITVLYPESDFRELLVERMRPLDIIKSANVADLSNSDLRRMSKWIEDIEPALARAEALVATGRRLLTQKNIQQLARFAHDKQERRAMLDFITRLPA